MLVEWIMWAFLPLTTIRAFMDYDGEMDHGALTTDHHLTPLRTFFFFLAGVPLDLNICSRAVKQVEVYNDLDK